MGQFAAEYFGQFSKEVSSVYPMVDAGSVMTRIF
jgi:hypothetical protein